MTLPPTARWWPAIFYTFGLVGALWCLLWQLFGASSPATHRLASPAEVQFIETSLAEAAAAAGEHETQGAETVPWAEFARSPALLAAMGAHFAHNWGSFLLLSWLPKYLVDAHGVGAR